MAKYESEVLMEARDQGMRRLRFQFGVRREEKNRGQRQPPQQAAAFVQGLRACRRASSVASGYWLKSVSKNCFRIGQLIIPDDAG